MNKIFYLLFLAVFLLLSCSRLDDNTSLGQSIVEDKAQDGLQTGVYNTIILNQSAGDFSSVVHTEGDTVSGMQIFTDSLQNNGRPNSQWVIGNWQSKDGAREETILRLTHATDSIDKRVVDYLFRLTEDTTVVPGSIRAEVIWTNIVGLNSFDNVPVEVGAVFGDKFFPLNFAMVNTRTSVSAVPLTIDTYLMNESRDSTKIQRFNATFTNFVDTVFIDSIFRRADERDRWGYVSGDSRNDTVPAASLKDPSKYLRWTTDTLILWQHFVAPSFYDSVFIAKRDTIVNNEFRRDIKEEIRLLSRRVNNTRNTIGTIERENRVNTDNNLMIDTTFDKLIIDIDTTFRSLPRRIEHPYKGHLNDSAVFHTRFISTRGIADTLTQIGLRYITRLDGSETGLIRLVGGRDLAGTIDTNLLSNTLDMYLRVDRNSNAQSIMHLTAPAVRIWFRRVSGRDNRDTTLQNQVIRFTDARVEARISGDGETLTDEMPVISGALERFVEIDLNLNEFFTEIRENGFLSVGLADLTLGLDPRTDFPVQYGDSIRVSAIISEKRLTPKSLYALPRGRLISSTFARRNSSNLRIPLTFTMTDFVYRHRLFENTPPEKAYLYLWLDDPMTEQVMGRIWFNPNVAPIFTYILQTRRDSVND